MLTYIVLGTMIQIDVQICILRTINSMFFLWLGGIIFLIICSAVVGAHIQREYNLLSSKVKPLPAGSRKVITPEESMFVNKNALAADNFNSALRVDTVDGSPGDALLTGDNVQSHGGHHGNLAKVSPSYRMDVFDDTGGSFEETPPPRLGNKSKDVSPSTYVASARKRTN
jgi:hypothetical protein